MPEPRKRKEREEAAQLIAAGELGDSAIAEKVGVTRKSIWDWRRDPEFMAQVDKFVDRISVSLSRRAISYVERRVDALNHRWVGLQRVVDERAVDPLYASEPGGGTGLLVRRVKRIGSGKNAREFVEFAVDVRLLTELRRLEKQAAQELGQWKNKGNSRRSLASPETSAALDLGLELYEDPDDCVAEALDGESDEGIRNGDDLDSVAEIEPTAEVEAEQGPIACDALWPCPGSHPFPVDCLDPTPLLDASGGALVPG